MSHDILINTGRTLSVNSSPGQDKRYPNVSTESIFSWGDFRMHRNITSNSLSADSKSLVFSNFGTLSSLSSNTEFDAIEVVNIDENDLNINRQNPNSYTYFGSFYTKVASAINNIIEKFPYAMLAYDFGTGNTIYNYVNNPNGSASFYIPVSAITNQGNVIYASGFTRSNSADTIINLYTDYNQFEIELSSTTLHQSAHTISSYTFDPINQILNFVIEDSLFGVDTLAATVPIYIRPSLRRYYQYKKTISDIEYQLWFEQKFLAPSDDDDTFISTTFTWPTTIDGFNPDTYGTAFTNYISTILRAAEQVDNIKTNWMIRTMLPENYVELDSENHIYQKLTTVFADEFDKIKKYIDNLAYAHSVTYNNEESIPDKFLNRLSTLLGWEPINEFTEVDIFDYLAKEDRSGYTFKDYNLDSWKRILININWLYKKKGTRDALEFIFKLMGAPDCLIHFDELVYRINQSATDNSDKVSDNGYPNYNGSELAFQEGGKGRGNGDAYIRQWEPEFNPIPEIDNKKVYTGDTANFGTGNIINSKEVNIEISPADAIECDVQDWYNLLFLTGTTTASAAGLPSYVKLADVKVHVPSSISGFTMSQWMDYIYTNSIDPTKRKTHKVVSSTTFFYNHLKDIYLTYYYWSVVNETSNALNFRKLEPFLEIIQRSFHQYIERLIPATTILEGQGIVYRNTIFNRQKFVYPTGINDGSEFQIKAPLNSNLNIDSTRVTATINDNFNPTFNSVNVNLSLSKNLSPTISTTQVVSSISTGINKVINAVTISADFNSTQSITKSISPEFIGNISTFPIGGTPQGQPPSISRPFRTRIIDRGTETANINDIQI
mgnify:CR=1 FL=1